MRLDEMQRALADVQKMYVQVLIKGNDSHWATDVFASMRSLVSGGNSVAMIEEGVENARKTAETAIGLLNGSVQSEVWGNCFTTAQTDDNCYAAWKALCADTGAALSQALSVSFNMSDYFTESVDETWIEIKKDLKEVVDESALPLALIAVIVVVIFLILLVK